VLAACDDARKWGPHIGAPNLVIDLSQPDLDQLGIGNCQVAIRFGLFEFELRNEIRAFKFLLPA
jgi:hypothetical protein